MGTTKNIKPLEELTSLERLKALVDFILEEAHPELTSAYMMTPEEFKGYQKGIDYAVSATQHLIKIEWDIERSGNATRSAESRLQDDKGSESHGAGQWDPSTF